MKRSNSRSVRPSSHVAHPILEDLESRLLLNAAPTFATPLYDQYWIDKPRSIGINGADAEGDPLTISAVSDNPDLTVLYHPTTNHFARLHFVGSDGTTVIGDIVVELLQDTSANATQRFITLATNHVNADHTLDPNGVPFYTNVLVHRVIPYFMIQTGDATKGDGTGGSGLGTFSDLFDPNLAFGGAGVLGMANSGANTNDCQFFITQVAYPSGNGSYEIFGQVISGMDVLNQIINLPRNSSDRPNNPPKLQNVTIFTDNHDAVITLVATADFHGTANVTVSLNDGNGNITEKVIQVTQLADVGNRPTIPYPGDTYVTPGVAKIVDSGITDDMGMPMTMKITSSLAPATVSIDSTTGQYSITAPADYSGMFFVTIQAVEAGFAPDFADMSSTKSSFYVLTSQTNPLLPEPFQRVGLNQSLGGVARAVFMDNAASRMYVATETGGLSIYSIADPANISLLGYDYTDLTSSTNQNIFARDVKVVNDVAYVADMAGGIVALDVHDPTNITKLGSAKSPLIGTSDSNGNPIGLTLSVTISGNVAYASEYSAGLTAYDIHDPTHITVLSTLKMLDALTKHTIIAAIGSVVRSGRYITVSDAAGQLVSIDAADPTHMKFLTYFPNGGSPWGIVSQGDYAYLGDQKLGLQIYNVSNPKSLKLVSTLTLPQESWRQVAVSNQSVIVGDGTGYSTVDITDIKHPKVTWHYTAPTYGGAPAFANGKLAMPIDVYGVLLADVAGMINGLTITKSLAFPDDHGIPVTISVSGGTVRVSTSGAGFGQILGIAVNGNASKVTVTTKGGDTSTAGITIDKTIGSFSAPTLKLTGNLNAKGGVGSLVLSDVVNGNINLHIDNTIVLAANAVTSITLDNVSDGSINTNGTGIKSLTVTRWTDTDGQPELITAPWIGSLTATGQKATKTTAAISGDFSGDLRLDSANTLVLGSAKIAGLLYNADWQIKNGAAKGAVGALSIDHIGSPLDLGATASLVTKGSLIREMAAGQFVDYVAIEGADRINRLKFASLGKPPATLFDYTPTGGQLPAGELLSRLTLIDLKKVANASLGKWAGDAGKLKPGLLPSFGATTDPNYASVKGVAFVYDNALAIESLLMGGTADAEAMARAFQIADALVVLQNFDPANLTVTADSEFTSLRPAMLRDAYKAGPAASDPAGVKPKVRLTSGFNNFSSGNQAYVAMALLRASDVANQAGDDARASNYRDTARELLLAVGRNRLVNDGLQGFYLNADPTVGHSRSTENNLDLATAFSMAAGVETDPALQADWVAWSDNAKAFVNQMRTTNARLATLDWIGANWQYFHAGADAAGVIDNNLVPIDTGAWAALQLGNTADVAFDLLEYLSSSQDAAGNSFLGFDPGFRAVSDFNLASYKDGVGSEATAYMVLLARKLGDAAILAALPDRASLASTAIAGHPERLTEQEAYDAIVAAANSGLTDHDLADNLLNVLSNIQFRAANGDGLGLVAAPVAGVGTGEYQLVNGWSLASTCWASFAYSGWDMYTSAAL